AFREVLRLALAIDGDPPEVVVGAPRLMLLRRRGEYEVRAIRAEGVIDAGGKRRRGREGVPVAGSHVARLAGLAALEITHEQMLPLVLDVFIPVAEKEPLEDAHLDGAA